MKIGITSFELIIMMVLLVISPNPGLAGEMILVAKKIPDVQLNASDAGPYSRTPDYDSGWTDIGAGADKIFTHNLGGNPDDYLVDLQAYNPIGGVHEYYLGSDSSYSFGHKDTLGYYWYNLNAASISVKRYNEDFSAVQVRVRIWVVPDADYDSGWKPIETTKELSLDHNLKGNPDDYVVDIQFNNLGGLGINNCKYGMDTFFKDGVAITTQGAAWQKLTSNAIEVFRAENDINAFRVRVRIWRVTNSNYDSGWQKISKGTSVNLPHDLGGPWNDFIVDLQFKHNGQFGVHQISYGGDEVFFGDTYTQFGAWLDTLNNHQMNIQRGADDTNVDEVKVRIWANPEPKYDSGWKNIVKGEILTLKHDLGGIPDYYVVDMQFKDTSEDKVNGHGQSNTNYGGDSFENHPSRQMEFHGAYWSGLTSSQIEVNRQPNDVYADQVRVRIWIPPVPSFDSQWISINPGGMGLNINHIVSGDADDYVVDMQFKDTSAAGAGINQHFFGGNNYQNSSGALTLQGVSWSRLNNASLHVIHGSSDTSAEEVRVRIWKNPNPDYDSNWTLIAAGNAKDFIHQLGRNPDDYLLNLQFLDNTTAGVHQIYVGHNTSYAPTGTPIKSGAFWFGLNESSVKVNREVSDVYVHKARVRIWVVGKTPINDIYLPVMLSSN